MRFTLLTFSAPIPLIWHQALGLPSVLPPTPNTEVTVWNIPRTAPYNPATHQMLDLRAVDVEATANLNTRSLQTRAVPWQSSTLKRRLVVGLSTAVATTIHLANAALSWKISLMYHTDARGREGVTGIVYSDGDMKAYNLKLCVNGVKTWSFGNNNNQYWVDADVDLEGTYHDSTSGNVVTMFWTASMRFAQDALNTVHHMVHDPTGYEIVPGVGLQTCLAPKGKAVDPTSWTFDGW